MKKYYILYKTTCLINNKIYIGVHSTNNLNDGYYGSGKKLKADISKYGKHNFKREILKYFNTSEEMYLAEKEIVTLDFIKSNDNYNSTIGGSGRLGKDYHKVVLRHKITKKTLFLLVEDINDELLKEYEYTGSGRVSAWDKINNCSCSIPQAEFYNNPQRYCTKTTHKTTYIDKSGITYKLDIDDPLIKEKNLKGINSKKAAVRLPDGIIKLVDINSEEYKNSQHINNGFALYKDETGKIIRCDKTNKPENVQHINKGFVTVKDKSGNTFRVSKNDPRYLSGELVSNMKGMCYAKDLKTMEILFVEINDSRFKTNEIMNLRKWNNLHPEQHIIWVIDENKNKFKITADDPRYLNGELKKVRSSAHGSKRNY